jgi:hypothetical protein
LASPRAEIAKQVHHPIEEGQFFFFFFFFFSPQRRVDDAINDRAKKIEKKGDWTSSTLERKGEKEKRKSESEKGKMTVQLLET